MTPVWSSLAAPEVRMTIISVASATCDDNVGIMTIDQFHKTMNPFHIPQCTIQNKNGHNGALWEMEQVHCELGQLSGFGARL